MNQNGFIEFGEFLHWTALQCGLSTNERNKERKKSDLADRMQNFVIAIRKAAKILLIEKRQIEANFKNSKWDLKLSLRSLVYLARSNRI